MGEVYLEEWRISMREPGLHIAATDSDISLRGLSSEQVKLIGAAPEMVRALLSAEWFTGYDETQCPSCRETQYDGHPRFGHSSICPLDVALVLAGFSDQASRDEARRRMREVGR
jgi:hypothetical protein